MCNRLFKFKAHGTAAGICVALADFDSQIACLMLLFPTVADSVKSCS